MSENIQQVWVAPTGCWEPQSKGLGTELREPRLCLNTPSVTKVQLLYLTRIFSVVQKGPEMRSRQHFC